jgi:hypothetical protein
MHTPNQIVNLEDVESSTRIIAGFLTQLEADAGFLPL